MTSDPTPAGYREATIMSDSMWGFVCLTCGSVVARREAGVHTAWHATLITVADVERAGRSVRHGQP